MHLFISATPLFSASMAVESYRLYYQYGKNQADMQNSSPSEAPGIAFLGKVGISSFAGDKPLFVPLDKAQLLSGLPHSLTAPTESVRFIFRRDVLDEPICHQVCKHLREKGYGLAAENPFQAENSTLARDFLELCDYIFLDAGKKQAREYLPRRGAQKKPGAILTNIDTQDTFTLLRALPDALFEGQFYSQPITEGDHALSPVKVNVVRLLRFVGNTGYDLSEAIEAIGHDPAIALALMRFINSAGIPATQEITSIKSAALLLGPAELRKWLAAAISLELSRDKPTEIARLSLLRARFAENLAPVFSQKKSAASLFLMGLFSLLDVMLDLPIEKALGYVPLDTSIAGALLGHPGEFTDILRFIYQYERANWSEVADEIIRRDLDADAVSQAYLDALVWYRDIFVSIQTMAV